MKYKWRILAAVALLAGLAAAAPMFRANRFREPIRLGVERALGRPVDVRGEARLALVPRPGFSLTSVTIHELPQFGREPMAYVSELQVSLSLLPLLGGRLEPAAIRLVEPSINLTRHPSAGWNFLPLLEHALAQGDKNFPLPDLEVSLGRLNYKSADVKSTVYLADADLRLTADHSARRFGVEFRGEPARTDRATRPFGSVSGRGMLELAADSPSTRLRLSLAVERTPIAEIVNVLGHGWNPSEPIRGMAAFRGRVDGPISDLALEGRVELENVEQWRSLLPLSGRPGIAIRGNFKVQQQTLEIETTSGDGAMPVAARFSASGVMGQPQWRATVHSTDLPLESARAIVAELGHDPGAVEVAGAVSGELALSSDSPPEGNFSATGLRFAPGGVPVEVPSATLTIAGGGLRFSAADLALGSGTASLDLQFRDNHILQDARVQWRRVPIPEFRRAWDALGFPAAPLSEFDNGLLTGQSHLSAEAGVAPSWSGSATVTQAVVPIPGLEAPFRADSMQLQWRNGAAVYTAFTGSAGGLEVSGSFRPAVRPAARGQLDLRIRQTSIAELAELFEPSLNRGGGIVSRALRRNPAMPAWLAERRLAAAVRVDELRVGGASLDSATFRATWTGPRIAVSNLSAALGAAFVRADVELGLGASVPTVEGTVEAGSSEWSGGALDVKARISGSIDDLRAQGTFSVTAVGWEPGPAIDTATGNFAYSPQQRIRLSAVRAEMDGEAYTGSATTANDRLQLDLVPESGAPLHYTGRFAAGDLRLEPSPR